MGRTGRKISGRYKNYLQIFHQNVYVRPFAAVWEGQVGKSVGAIKTTHIPHQNVYDRPSTPGMEGGRKVSGRYNYKYTPSDSTPGREETERSGA